MKKLLFFISLIFVSLVLVSCVGRKPSEPVVLQNTKEIIKTVRDTVYKIDADSSYYYAYVDCKNGKPIIRENANNGTPYPQSKPGKGLNIPKVTLDGNKLNVECYKKAEELFKTWRDTYIKDHEQTPIYIDKPVPVDKPISWFVKAQIWLGRFFLGIIALFSLIGVLRWKKII